MRLRSKVSWEGKLVCPAHSKITLASTSLSIDAGSSETPVPVLQVTPRGGRDTLRSSRSANFLLRIQSTN